MQSKTLISALVLSAGLAAGGVFTASLFAQERAGAPPAATAGTLSIVQIHERLEAAGYRNIEKIERERDRYEVDATDRDGRRVELEVDAASGRVIDVDVKPDRRAGRGETTRRGARNEPRGG